MSVFRGLGQRAMKLIRRLPRPEYTEFGHWDRVYERHTGAVPIEWGLPPQEVANYKYTNSNSIFFNEQEVEGSLEEHVSKRDKVMVAGCGNSLLSEYLFLCGWKNLTSVDFSAVGVKQVQQRAVRSGLGDMKFVVADMRRLHETFPRDAFDCVVDKGTLDAMYCSSDADTAVPHMKESLLRVLRGGGRYVCVTNGGVYGLLQPVNLVQLLDDPRWDTLEQRRLLPLSDGMFLYVWTKKKKS